MFFVYKGLNIFYNATLQKVISSKQKSEKKRKKKKSLPAKNLADIDVLHLHTETKLHEMEKEQKKNIYNFEVSYLTFSGASGLVHGMLI